MSTPSEKAKPVQFRYRPEVDGLRALAVIPVILFHAGFRWFKGGYVGVDVFFVISGYLITSIIVRERSQGTFSIVRFYERRARRILPALSVVMLACIPFALRWMMPDQLKQFAQSVAAVMLFSSNMLFWRTSGYFEPAAEQKPLLHTWSLGVEEQYYLLFPLLMALAWRLGLRRIIWLLGALALVSLGLSEVGWRLWPTANFFLAPTRAWEILLGSIVAIVLVEHPQLVARRRIVTETLATAGILLIAAAIFFFDDLTPMPSSYGLVPTVGAALVIAFATSETLVGRALSTRAVVAVGLASYSAYLWHQPLFAFARLHSLTEPSHALFAGLCLLTIALAYLTWRFIETPFRDKKRVSRRRIFQASAVAVVGFIAAGVTGHVTDGFRAHQNARATADGYLVFDVAAELARRKKTLDESKARLAAAFSRSPLPRLLVIGDSHSNDLALAYLSNAAAFDRRCQFRKIEITEACFGTTAPIARTRECVEVRANLVNSGLLDTADRILIVVRWAETDVTRLAPWKAELGRNGDKIVLVGRTAEFFDVPSLLARFVKTRDAVSVPELGRVLARYRVTSIDTINDHIRAEAARLHVPYLDKKDLICAGDSCDFLNADKQPYYFDYGHWSLVGAQHFGERIVATNWLQLPAGQP